MKVAIIGGGAIGLLIASYILPEHQVTIYTRTKEQAKVLQGEGVLCLVGDKWHQRSVQAVSFSEGDIVADIYIVAVKQYSLANIFPLLQKLQGELILFVQNGMGHIRDLEQFQMENIAVGMVEHGAKKLGFHEIKHTGQGSIKVGAVKGNIPRLTALFSEQDFPIYLEDDWETTAMRKLIVNTVINPLTALYRVENGVLVANPYFLEMMNKVFEETYAVIGVEEKEVMWQNVMNICQRTSKNKSSMLKDIESKQKTEIDYIVGYVLKEGERKEIPMPYLTFLYNSIKGIEETFHN